MKASTIIGIGLGCVALWVLIKMLPTITGAIAKATAGMGASGGGAESEIENENFTAANVGMSGYMGDSAEGTETVPSEATLSAAGLSPDDGY